MNKENSRPVINQAIRRGIVGDNEDSHLMKKMKFQLKHLSKMLEQASDSIMVTDAEGVIAYVNPSYTRLKGCRREALLGKMGCFTNADQASNEVFLAQVRPILKKGETYREIRTRRCEDETLYYEELSISSMVDEKGEITHFIVTGRDITKQILAQEKLYRLAYYDLLTQLPNRALFLDRFKHAIAGMRNGVKTLGLLFLDLDRFKNVNDTLGHDIGDKLLGAYASRLVECMREVDTIARHSGDEFIVLLEDISSAVDAAPICTKILSTLSQPFNIQGHELFLTTSIGISMYPQDGTDLPELMKSADQAMYRAKKAGGNIYQFYADVLRKTGNEDLAHGIRVDYRKNRISELDAMRK